MQIHPTAIVSPQATLADDVVIGAYAIIEGPCRLGPGTVVHPRASVLGPATLGKGNVIHSGAIVGGTPQDRKFKDEFSELLIGDDNVFREGVTIHRGTGANTRTTIGNRCYFMANSHVGHNATVSNDVTLVNGAVMAGHTFIGDRSILGAYCSVHQFCRIGRLVMLSNAVGFNVDVPPFFLSMTTNAVNQLNSVGLRRSGMPQASINALRQMLQNAFRDGRARPVRAALSELPAELRAVPEVAEVIAFILAAKRGVARFMPWSQRKAAQRHDVSA